MQRMNNNVMNDEVCLTLLQMCYEDIKDRAINIDFRQFPYTLPDGSICSRADRQDHAKAGNG